MRGRSDLVASAAYPPDPSAAAAARRFVRQTLQSWDIAARTWDPDRLVDDAVLLTSELVTNAVVHAGTPLDVTCRLTSCKPRHPSYPFNRPKSGISPRAPPCIPLRYRAYTQGVRAAS